MIVQNNVNSIMPGILKKIEISGYLVKIEGACPWRGCRGWTFSLPCPFTCSLPLFP
jgi:hypothetical protein